jgi:hypothetical protein
MMTLFSTMMKIIPKELMATKSENTLLFLKMLLVKPKTINTEKTLLDTLSLDLEELKLKLNKPEELLNP